MRDYSGLSIYTSAADGYDIGYIAGVKDVEKIAIENGKKAIDEAYQLGCNEAWECAKFLRSKTELTLEKIFGKKDGTVINYVFDNLAPKEAIDRIKEYEEKQEQYDKINIGDEVESWWGTKGIVIKTTKEVDDTEIEVVLINDEDKILRGTSMNKHFCTKTGRHFSQIPEILKQIGEDSDK